jgi:hypothetical protein
VTLLLLLALAILAALAVFTISVQLAAKGIALDEQDDPEPHRPFWR